MTELKEAVQVLLVLEKLDPSPDLLRRQQEAVAEAALKEVLSEDHGQVPLREEDVVYEEMALPDMR